MRFLRTHNWTTILLTSSAVSPFDSTTSEGNDSG
ncbi:uncharacterized protein FIBRA_09198 [Fibroporia radiculosa]|uniref:Uncharacterized protein n=1 Tax=Fibroporia radiculosa TaxID=599839 RepID=J7SCT4_9APHY|nr:uncharacterized protein FIBRA_09198 [Fibroporia radiculosa]CCM06888.1 predicted protein [Fibroporia radiculosa]